MCRLAVIIIIVLSFFSLNLFKTSKQNNSTTVTKSFWNLC